MTEMEKKNEDQLREMAAAMVLHQAIHLAGQGIQREMGDRLEIRVEPLTDGEQGYVQLHHYVRSRANGELVWLEQACFKSMQTPAEMFLAGVNRLVSERLYPTDITW
ncbi:hypothetical protein [Gordonia sp. IITR100]|uniref:hypothetical protein n=1 Tax=Gordonia sp. IITR100 TaxID=1314686 RepID=UPI0009911638|nr:hypothetical protein [Gordonia sp. IITR100]